MVSRSTNPWKNRITMAPDDPNRKRRPVMRTGNFPDPKQHPLTLAELHLSDRTQWWVTVLRAKLDGAVPDNADDWLNLKLHAKGQSLHKANFWVSWHVRQMRLNARLDTRALNTLRPELAAAAIGYLTWMTQQNAWALLPNTGLHIVRPNSAGGVVIEVDPTYEALTLCGMAKPRLFSDADKPRLKELGAIVMAQHAHRGWTMAPDALGGFTLQVKP